MDPKPYQIRTYEATLAAWGDGFRRPVVTIPTGGGKSLVMLMLAQHRLSDRLPVALFANRNLLTEQVSDALMDANMYHGVRSAGYADERDHPLQVCSFQTETSRVLNRKLEDLHAAVPGGLALFDEGHLYNNPTGREIIRRYIDAGADVALFTATPLDMAEVADRLVVGATNGELRDCGMLVEARHYRLCEPDLKRFKKLRAKLERGEQPSEAEAARAMPPPAICGYVLDDFERTNPEHKRTIGFGPSRAGAAYFAEQFWKRGIPTAYIDADDIYWNGRWYRSDRSAREELIGTKEKPGAFRQGDVKVLWNRYVMRQAVDIPEVEHVIFATLMGFASYLQSGGRGLRACSWIGKTHCTYQDHAGLYWRFGSLNTDWVWRLGDTAALVVGARLERIRQKKEKEPFGCPNCGRVWVSGRVCNQDRGGCGFELNTAPKVRPVIAAPGRIELVKGDIVQPRRIATHPDGPKIWERIIYKAHSAKWPATFLQAEANYARENNWFYPDRSWPLMPINEYDFFLPVATIPLDRLRGDPELLEKLARYRENQAKRREAMLFVS